MKLLIAGDLVVNQSYNPSEKIDQSLIDLFSSSDLNIVNLEAPVTDSESKILKTGPNIKSNRESTVAVLKALKVDVATLANNHVLDYGEKGVADTLEFCNQQGVKTVGAGMNLNEASKTLYIDTDEGKVAIVNFAENEWSSATETTAGANPMDIIDNAAQIKDARNNADYVIVIIHGGHEYYNLPSPRMQKQYRFYAEQGADIVVGHHTHCISGREVWKGVPIYYSLGNFLFTRDSVYKDWYKGLVIEIEIENKTLTHILHSVRQDQASFNLRLKANDAKDRVMNRVQEYDNIIENADLLKTRWTEYVKSENEVYLKRWSPISFISNPYLKAIFHKLGIRLNTKTGLRLFLNLIRCESHRDLSKEVINRNL